jgi:NodT family efflux transporter outer membrane factor (OMF) lipoprotein
MLRRSSSLAILALISGCAVGPDFNSPAAPSVTGYTAESLPPQTTKSDVAAGTAQQFIQDMDVPGQWWTLFHSQQLDQLVDEALKANPDVQSAQAALRVAQENVYAQQGAYFPSVQGNFTPGRNKTATGTLSPATASGNPYYSLYTGQVTVSYTLDVFGLNRRTVESLKAMADAQRFELEATYLTLTSNVVAAAIDEASLRGQIAATDDIIKVETDALAILRRQLSLGQVAGTDVAAQEAALAQAQTNLPPLEKQLAQERDLLTELIGHFPTETPTATFELGDLELPQDLPVSLPSKLVQQRPDIRAAEAQLHSASAEIGVAIANMLPNITLSANEGVTAISVDRLFGPGTAFWTLMASLTQPLFEGGQLLHKTRAARAAFDEAAAQYRSTVLTAFQNVADALHAVQSDANLLAAADAAERAARTTLDLTRLQLDHGQVPYLALLSAEQAYQLAHTNLVQAQAQRYADTDALFQALGGGWWNRADIVTSGSGGS